MTTEASLTTEQIELLTIAEILLERRESLASKANDQTWTSSDKINLSFTDEIIALARNRVAVSKNVSEQGEGKNVWVERTSESHHPHVRLHGGVREDDVPK